MEVLCSPHLTSQELRSCCTLCHPCTCKWNGCTWPPTPLHRGKLSTKQVASFLPLRNPRAKVPNSYHQTCLLCPVNNRWEDKSEQLRKKRISEPHFSAQKHHTHPGSSLVNLCKNLNSRASGSKLSKANRVPVIGVEDHQYHTYWLSSLFERTRWMFTE